MNEDPHWVTKAEAMRALDVSLSTLDRMIRKGEVEVRREGRRVYVRMLGRSYLSDAELLRRATVRLDESQQEVLRLKQTISALERERDEAREALSDGRLAHYKLESAHEKEVAEHKATAVVFNVVRVIVVVLLVVVGLLTWRRLA